VEAVSEIEARLRRFEDGMPALREDVQALTAGQMDVRDEIETQLHRVVGIEDSVSRVEQLVQQYREALDLNANSARAEFAALKDRCEALERRFADETGRAESLRKELRESQEANCGVSTPRGGSHPVTAPLGGGPASPSGRTAGYTAEARNACASDGKFRRRFRRTSEPESDERKRRERTPGCDVVIRSSGEENEREMATFDFVASGEFRASLERDAEELLACMKAGAWKSVHVLAGSLNPCDDLYHLTSTGKVGENELLKLSLSELLDLCKEQQVLSTRDAGPRSVHSTIPSIHPSERRDTTLRGARRNGRQNRTGAT